ncbi:putative 3-demethylubiquinone-9 3-methyltransferase (glyoxalase superfamily) [Curtobacterium sp. PhB130]|uniref:VOC family protein n=1 Tax=Curtobacterium sp. PhB130 TaxID=2485178 RepID=UPI000F4BB34A|nr:VOC family protein [Curtobacterium sp. PhB130]ROS72236.1 putative 3-demethylubiquinone-9 3-methyltransferase (glyoxalase superfamily) [Curtobacterium sp. PhB130]
MRQIVPFIWFDGQAEEAATFYTSVIPDSSVQNVQRLPDGTTMVVEFVLGGKPYRAMNAGPGHPHSDAISFQIDVDDQDELDRIWDAFLDAGGTPSMCGWLTDAWGVSWQVTPANWGELMSAGGDPEGRARAFDAMMRMVKLDIPALEAAIRGE